MAKLPTPTIAVAESLTCGNLQAAIGAVSGASAYFLGGVTAYSLEQKVSLLGVDRTHAAGVDCVSERVAREMALGACRMFSSEFGLATTGYAEASGTVARPFAWWALCWIRPDHPPHFLSGRWDAPPAPPAPGRVEGSRAGPSRVEGPGLSRVEGQKQIARHVYDVWRAFIEQQGFEAPRPLA